MSTDARPATAAVHAAVSALHLGRWTAVADRLLPRLTPLERAGPLGRPVPHQPWAGGSPRLAWDVAIDLPGGVGFVDDGLIAAWGQPAGRIWRQAVTNLPNRAPLRIGSLHAGSLVEGGGPGPIRAADPPARLRVLAGGPWTTGWLLPGSGLDVGPNAVAVVVDAGSIAVADHEVNPATDPTADRADPPSAVAATGLTRRVWPVAEKLCELRGLGAGGMAVLVRQGGLSPTGGFWNDVPVPSSPSNDRR